MDKWIRRILESLRLVRASSMAENTRPVACLGQQYAGCNDQRHCANCSQTEQALRVATRHTDGA